MTISLNADELEVHIKSLRDKCETHKENTTDWSATVVKVHTYMDRDLSTTITLYTSHNVTK